ncbi:urease accessory protein UreD [Halococcus sp. IIIV-5B]|uniref:urease accessory protein UreD n=1 Tax=Halococcus sp. IIIV-5B TaxID=2321230 RepID=UPI000E732005|nr:urease accessory protein UreD [Halococcus sp. IIIV-5B]RJT07461.1 urease accessory protein UreD [Halococcus sp. IIIV-5B]
MATNVPHPAFETYAGEEVPQASPGSPGKTGELELSFATDSDGQTRLVHDYARVPFHVMGTLDHDPHPNAATVCVQSPTGGIAQGDRLRSEVHVKPEAIARVSTQSATKVQSMDHNYASETTKLTADASSHLDYVPEPTILHEDARFSRETTLSVSENATAIVSELLIPGRLARDECFDFEQYYSRFKVGTDDDLLFEDTTHLQPETVDPSAPGIWADFSVYGTLYVVASHSNISELADQLYEHVALESGQVGVTALPNDAGVMVRLLTERSEQAQTMIRNAWDTARRFLLNVGAPALRRY